MAKRKSASQQSGEGAPTALENLVSDLNEHVMSLRHRVFSLEQREAGFKFDESRVPPAWVNVREQEEKDAEEKEEGAKANASQSLEGEVGHNFWEVVRGA